MTTIDESGLFYPLIKRRDNYQKSNRGEYYADYAIYREAIRQDCIGRCVYCDCHENENGGPQHMNLDHFRPKAVPRFEHLRNNPENLVWACAGCNQLKGDYWPDRDSDNSIVGNIGFVEPFKESYRDYFEVQVDGSLLPKKVPAKYMIEFLGLNRISKRKNREMRLVKCKIINGFDEQISRVRHILDSTLGDDERYELEIVLSWLIETRDKFPTLLDFTLYPLVDTPNQ
jgi:hypothetical protein